MSGLFHGSRLKIERANKHILDLNGVLLKFVRSDFYAVRIDRDSRKGTTHLCIDFDPSQFPSEEAALVIGDALHNLRSALDLLYYEVVRECGASGSKWARFPIRDTRDELIAPLHGALKEKKITQTIHDFILDTIKPYKAGNLLIWALDDLNIRDKHQLLIPVLKMVRFDDIRLVDEKGLPINENRFYVGDAPSRFRLVDGSDDYAPDIDRDVTVKDNGHASAGIFFDLGTALQGEPVIPTLNRITEEVTRTVEAFDISLGKG